MLLKLLNYRSESKIIEIPDDILIADIEIMAGDERIRYVTKEGIMLEDPFRGTRWQDVCDGSYEIFNKFKDYNGFEEEKFKSRTDSDWYYRIDEDDEED